MEEKMLLDEKKINEKNAMILNGDIIFCFITINYLVNDLSSKFTTVL